MNPMQLAHRIAGLATGIYFLSGFGTLWLGLALYAREQLGAASIVALVVVLAGFVVGATRLLRYAHLWPREEEDKRVSRTFHWVNAIQWVVCFLVSSALVRLHLQAYILTGITAIVGLHFYPLARVFRSPVHYVLGTLMVLWAGVACLIVPVDHMQGTTALGTATLLLGFCTVGLVRGFWMARQLPEPPAAQAAARMQESH
jgi:uncharacterized membrane protein YczE